MSQKLLLILNSINFLLNSQENVGVYDVFFLVFFSKQVFPLCNSNKYFNLFLIRRRGLLSVRVLRIRCIVCIEPSRDDIFLEGHKCWKKPELCHADEKWKNHDEPGGVEFLWHVSLSWNNTRCVGKLHSSSLER